MSDGSGARQRSARQYSERGGHCCYLNLIFAWRRDGCVLLSSKFMGLPFDHARARTRRRSPCRLELERGMYLLRLSVARAPRSGADIHFKFERVFLRKDKPCLYIWVDVGIFLSCDNTTSGTDTDGHPRRRTC